MKAKIIMDIKDKGAISDLLFGKMLLGIQRDHKEFLDNGQMFLWPEPRPDTQHGGLIKVYMEGSQEQIHEWADLNFRERLGVKAMKKMLSVKVDKW